MAKLKEVVAEEIKKAIPMIVQSTIIETNKCNEKLSDACDQINTNFKSYADVLKNSLHSEEDYVSLAIKSTSETALKDTMVAIENHDIDKKRRMQNIIISGIDKDTSTELNAEVYGICQTLIPELKQSEILRCTHLGREILPHEKPQPRLVLVKLKYKEDAEFLHRNGLGRNYKHDGWINPDLTVFEREARYKMRLKRREALKLNNNTNPDQLTSAMSSSSTSSPPKHSN